AEVAQHESRGAEHGAVESARLLRVEDRVLTPKAEQVAVQLVDFSMLVTLTVVELAALEGLGRAGVWQLGTRLARGDAAELREELGAAAFDLLGQVGLVVGEVVERRGGRELLTHKE